MEFNYFLPVNIVFGSGKVFREPRTDQTLW